MGEFELIQQYFASRSSGVAVVGIGDDGAVLNPVIPGRQQVVCLDTLVAGRHFRESAAAADIGWKSLAVNLSDLAAMGATPEWFQLGLTLPEADESWLSGFAEGLFECAEQFGITLIGGDTTRGPLSITVQAAGSVPAGKALLRIGARAGDDMYVSGVVGAAALALNNPQANQQPLNRPVPRLALGAVLATVATAAVDISDGLLADCGHVLEQSGVGAMVEIERLPLADGISEANIELALAGGDDYELLFTVPPSTDLSGIEIQTGTPLTRIGKITAEIGLGCIRENGAPYNSATTGWQHFSS